MKRRMLCGVLLFGLCQHTFWADPQGGQVVAEDIIHTGKPTGTHPV